ncbi:hypothetical protein, partial [Streptomyces rubellomurinus]|uniref:hypothetical protein n=1 Tax=Streptomyces rubellomurinus (strain ATCC 31215) TaxID=359131 RepID=UPI001ABF76C4
LHGTMKVTVHQAVEALLRAPDGRSGKDYLGYLQVTMRCWRRSRVWWKVRPWPGPLGGRAVR